LLSRKDALVVLSAFVLCQKLFNRIICNMSQKSIKLNWEEVILMNRAQREAASTCCTDKDKGLCFGNFNLKEHWIWIVVVVVILCCCSGGSFIPGPSNCCRPQRGCRGTGRSGGGLGNYWWALILLAVLCGGSGGLGGIGGLGNPGGNVNTNVINVAANEGYEECDDYCC
jgi:hypothetical protein